VICSSPAVKRSDRGIKFDRRNFDAVAKKARRVSTVDALVDFESFAHARCSSRLSGKYRLFAGNTHPCAASIGKNQGIFTSLQFLNLILTGRRRVAAAKIRAAKGANCRFF